MAVNWKTDPNALKDALNQRALDQNRQDVQRAANLRRSIGNRRHLKPGQGPRIAR